MSTDQNATKKPGDPPRRDDDLGPRSARPPARRDAPAEEDADFGEEFGHTVKKDGSAGGEGFQRDEYDKVV